MSEEVKVKKQRQTLDEMGPQTGARVKVFFPYGRAPQVMLAAGEVKSSSSLACEHDHLLRDEKGANAEWVPGWYVVTSA